MAYGIETGLNGRFVYLDIRVEAGFLCRVRVLQEFGARRNRFFFDSISSVVQVSSKLLDGD